LKEPYAFFCKNPKKVFLAFTSLHHQGQILKIDVGPVDVVCMERMMKFVWRDRERSVRHENPPFQEDHTTVPRDQN
jgi:hypothetical protein